MAYNKNNTTGNKKTQRQPIHDCKVCVDAGKSPEECASHYVRDRAGNVTCPTLLNQKCLLCGVCGHTASYCKTTATSTKQTPAQPQLKIRSIQPAAIQPAAKERPQTSNRYAILGLIEADAEEANEQRIAAFPPLEPKPVNLRPSSAVVVQTTAISAISSWASRLKSPPSPISQHSDQEQEQQQQQQQHRRKPTKPVAIAVSWADY